LSAAQLYDWLRLHAKYNLGLNRDDIHWGMSMAFFVNAHRGEDDLPVQATDLMPYHDPFEADMTAEELAARLPIPGKRREG
jgi:hypothetical protein